MKHLLVLTAICLLLNACDEETRMQKKIDGVWNIDHYSQTKYQQGQVIEDTSINNAGEFVFEYGGSDLSSIENIGSYAFEEGVPVIFTTQISRSGTGKFNWRMWDTDDRLILETQDKYFGFPYSVVLTLHEHSRSKMQWQYTVVSQDSTDTRYEIIEMLELRKN